MSLSKVLIYKGGELEKPNISLLAPTGVAAAININCTTIHSDLGINVGGKLYSLRKQHRAALRNKLSKVRLIIIDKLSMVSSVLVFQVNQRLTDIFRHSGKETFNRLPVIVCDDFYQLPPVKASPVCSIATSIKGFLALYFWKKFQMVELTEVMRQRGDYDLFRVLNKIRERNIDEDVGHTLKAQLLETKSYPEYAVHVFAEQKINQLNDIMKVN